MVRSVGILMAKTSLRFFSSPIVPEGLSGGHFHGLRGNHMLGLGMPDHRHKDAADNGGNQANPGRLHIEIFAAFPPQEVISADTQHEEGSSRNASRYNM